MKTVNPFIYGPPVSTENRFYGRQREISHVVDRLLNPGVSSTSVVGERRMGKSSLLRHLILPEIRQAHGFGADYLFLYVSLGGLRNITPTQFWNHILCELLPHLLDQATRNLAAKCCDEGADDSLQLRRVFENVAHLGLKIVLLLDEFESILDNCRFDVGFYGTLRDIASANSVALVTASRRPLQGYARSQEIASSPFFNIFSTVILRPFNKDDSLALIKGYLSATGISFTPGDCHYLLRVSGGHPFLLQVACFFMFDAYVSGGPGASKPSAEKRQRHVTELTQTEIDSFLAYYWNHSTAQEKTALAAFALANTLPLASPVTLHPQGKSYYPTEMAIKKLIHRGLVLDTGAEGYCLLSPLFVHWLQSELKELAGDAEASFDEWLDKPESALEQLRHIFESEQEANRASSQNLGHASPVSSQCLNAHLRPTITLFTDKIPTAYCHNLAATDFPLVQVTLDNIRGAADSEIRVTAGIEGFSDPSIVTRHVIQGQRVRLALLPVLRTAHVAALDDIEPATLRVIVEQTSPTNCLLDDHTERVYLLARDVALLALRGPDHSVVDLTDQLAAWVTPRRQEIEQLLRKGADYHPEKLFVGYSGAATLSSGADIVRRQARAIFDVLKHEAKLLYVNSWLNLGSEEDQIMQRIRLPRESLASGGSANCIDGAVLFASLMELASIDPFIVIVPGHAFVGWRIWRDVDQYEFLETTMIGYADFDAAQVSAQHSYQDKMQQGYLLRGLFDPSGFMRLVDIAACRKKGINPLPF